MDLDAPANDEPRRVRALLLLYRLSLAIDDVTREVLGDDAASNHDVNFLLTLHLNGPQSPTTLADGLGIDHSQASRHLADLESADLLVREPDPTDGRRRIVMLSERGRERIHDFDQAIRLSFTAGAGAMEEVVMLMGAPVQLEAPGQRDALRAVVSLSAAGERFVAEVVRDLEAFGIVGAFAERFILASLLALGAQRPGRLAHDLGSSAATVSNRLNGLEDAGLVARRRGDSHDRRAVVVVLTPRGRRAAQVLLDALARHGREIAASVAAALACVPDGAAPVHGRAPARP